jgi:hypothetical protein
MNFPVNQRSRIPAPVNAGILFLRLLSAHLLCLVAGLVLSLLTLPLWARLLYLVTGRDHTAGVSWLWYLLTLAPFYLAISTLTIFVLYPIWISAGDGSKNWQRVLTITAWIHLVLLLFINLIVGSRFIP